jgi:porin
MRRFILSSLPLALCLASSPGTAAAMAGPGPDSAAVATPSAMPLAAVPDARPGPPPAAALPMGAPANGWRALSRALATRGVTTSAALTGIWVGDVAGGVKTGGTAQSLAYGAADADLARLTGWWQGAHAFANVAFIRGGDLSGRFVGDALTASNLQAYASLRLYDAWIEQVFAGGRASLRLGCMGADEEFTGTDGGVMFTNSAFGWEAGIGANVINGGPIYFVPALGARIEYRPDERWVLRAGAYDGDSFDSPDGDPVVNAHGLRFSLSRTQGAFLIGEGTRAWGAQDGALPGRATLGAWRHTADFPDNRLDASGAPFAVSGLDAAMHHGNQGGYGVLEQKVWNSPAGAEAGIAGWVRLAGAPADRSAYAWVPEAGLRWTGLLPGRARDVLGIGWVCGIVSPSLRRQVRDANAADGDARPVPDHEGVLEAAYELRVGGHWVVTPDVQWVQHPGATTAAANATVAGLRLAWQ